jgi:hypothetical protein
MPSLERFTWMLAPQGCPPAGSVSAEDIKAACEFATRSCWRVLPAIYPKLVAWIRQGDPSAETLADLEAWHDSVRIFARVQSLHVLRLARELARRRIPYALIKGSALKWFAYSDPSERTGWDSDVAVARPNLEAALTIALEQGFIPAEGFTESPWFRPADPLRRARVEAEHHELGFLARRVKVRGLTEEQESRIRRQVQLGRTSWELSPSGELTCYVLVDIHHGLSQEIPVEPLLASSVSVPAEGMKVRVPDPAWALLHLVFKLYWEGVHHYGKGGYQYADVCRLVPLLDDAATAKFQALLAQWRLEAAAYFVLRRLTPEFGMKLSLAMRRLIEATSIPTKGLDPQAQNDLGDVWPKLWGGR